MSFSLSGIDHKSKSIEMNVEHGFIKGVILAVVVVVALGIYLFFSVRTSGWGFPLDDAWIHQVFARNFAHYGQWAFEPGTPSAGSTSPLWSTLLSFSYLLGLSPYVMPFLLGGLALWGLGMMAEKIFVQVVFWQKSWLPLAGLFIVGEWHLVWAAVSGMEILLFCLCLVGVFFLLLPIEADITQQHLIRSLVSGLLIGVSIWIRPEGLTILGPALFILLFIPSKWKQKVLRILGLVLGFICAFVPFLLFNFQLSGNWMPNTYFAKQAEYAFILEYPLIQRLYAQIRTPMIGSGLMLLPGVIFCGWWAFQKRWVAGAAFILWWTGFVVLYAVRLPVAYQHGRYQIPGMVIYFIIGLIGMRLAFMWLNEMKPNLIKRVLMNTWIYSLGGLWILFFVLGANAYSHDVGFINSEMVAASKWVATHTEPDALIAAHDIGAMGYFGQRKIIDLAGLVTPDVIPFIRNEEELKKYLDQKKVNYLFTFPDWYTYLVKFGEPVYITEGKFAEELGSTNMVVYRWR